MFERLWLSMASDKNLFTAFDLNRPLRTDAELRMQDSAVQAQRTGQPLFRRWPVLMQR